jgi:hypothetical protein
MQQRDGAEVVTGDERHVRGLLGVCAPTRRAAGLAEVVGELPDRPWPNALQQGGGTPVGRPAVGRSCSVVDRLRGERVPEGNPACTGNLFARRSPTHLASDGKAKQGVTNSSHINDQQVNWATHSIARSSSHIRLSEAVGAGHTPGGRSHDPSSNAATRRNPDHRLPRGPRRPSPPVTSADRTTPCVTSLTGYARRCHDLTGSTGDAHIAKPPVCEQKKRTWI